MEAKIRAVCDRIETAADGRPARVNVSGVIGAGKTKTISLLRGELERRGLSVCIQREELPDELFKLYLADRSTYWFPFQMAVAHLRAYGTLAATYARDKDGRPYDVVISERCVLDDDVFFMTNAEIEGVDKDTHPNIWQQHRDVTHWAKLRCVDQTDLFVCVEVSNGTAFRRMQTRDRVGECDAYADEGRMDKYFEMLCHKYRAFHDGMKHYHKDKTIVLDNEATSPLHVSASDI